MTGTAQYHGGAAGDYAKRDKGDAARQGRRQILHRTTKQTQHLMGDLSTADAHQKKRSSRRPWRGEMQSRS
jgi:hypothetical protein